MWEGQLSLWQQQKEIFEAEDLKANQMLSFYQSVSNLLESVCLFVLVFHLWIHGPV